jgi:hypothetical protein
VIDRRAFLATAGSSLLLREPALNRSKERRGASVTSDLLPAATLAMKPSNARSRTWATWRVRISFLSAAI